ncbi:hypothetical protein T459_17143 [Capsicum annuum]|uniref:RNase H type-1 domain-containing protein n=1 Tax=Capsicum annuum TaxID=4072 RepID=A0A2G2ZB07_CAPAN|nr:hypothetical protein T459_17143 [Capsicum annuum]
MKWEDMIQYVNTYRPKIHYLLVKWELPENGGVKCNTDGACRGNLGIEAYGFCLRNVEGDLLYAQGENIGHTTNVIAEMRPYKKQLGTAGIIISENWKWNHILY